jgi:hypothetical protein
MASIQLEEVKVAIAALQEKINEAEGKLVKSEERLEKAIIDGKTESVLASFRSLYDGASANLTSLRKEKEKLLEEKNILTRRETQGNPHEFKRPAKRLRSSSSVTSRHSNGSELTQYSFRQRILTRDTKGCVLTGKSRIESQACHIIPWTYFQKYDLIGQEIWNRIFPFSCNNPEHQVMDVRNGLLMWIPLHAQFDEFAFTIIKKGSTYEVEALCEDEMEPTDSQDDKEIQIMVASLNGKKIQFDKEKPELWPGEQFLGFHNTIFYQKREMNRLRAQAEVQEIVEEDANQTISEEVTESIMKVQNWNDLSVGRIEHIDKLHS